MVPYGSIDMSVYRTGTVRYGERIVTVDMKVKLMLTKDTSRPSRPVRYGIYHCTVSLKRSETQR